MVFILLQVGNFELDQTSHYYTSCCVIPWYSLYWYTGRPGGVSGCYRRAWYRSVSWVRAPPSAYSYKFVGAFSCGQIDLRKARQRELATLDEQSTSSGIAEPYARWKLKARTGEEKGRHLWPRLVQKLQSKSVQKKNTGMCSTTLLSHFGVVT